MDKMKKSWSLPTIMMAAMLSVGFASCGSDGDDNNAGGIDTSPISLYAGDKTTITGATDLESENEFVAYISSKDNSIVGYHVGETKVRVNGTKIVPVTVKGKYNLYDAPITEWGCNQSFIKSRQKQGTLSSKSNAEVLIYENAGKSSAMAYMFDNGALKGVGVVISTIYASELGSYFGERFLLLPIKSEDETLYGIDGLDLATANTVVTVSVKSASSMLVIYMPVPPSGNSSKAKANMIQKIKKLSL